MKVYGGNLSAYYGGKGRQTRAIVATTSWKKVSEITGLSLYYVRNWWSVTGNKDEIRIASENPGKIVLEVEIREPERKILYLIGEQGLGYAIKATPMTVFEKTFK